MMQKPRLRLRSDSQALCRLHPEDKHSAQGALFERGSAQRHGTRDRSVVELLSPMTITPRTKEYLL